tara:strand:- start:356 stop:565 length:210 start_codon:yes stop_codon:yes gene_type:complete
MEAGAWASVKIIPWLANLSRFGVLSVLSMGFVPWIKVIPLYALVSPIPMSSAINRTIFGLIIEEANNME